jgi:hypothetical protein
MELVVTAHRVFKSRSESRSPALSRRHQRPLACSPLKTKQVQRAFATGLRNVTAVGGCRKRVLSVFQS